MTTASKEAKKEGFKTLSEVLKLTGLPRSTLNDWSNKEPGKLSVAFDAAKYRQLLKMTNKKV